MTSTHTLQSKLLIALLFSSMTLIPLASVLTAQSSSRSRQAYQPRQTSSQGSATKQQGSATKQGSGTRGEQEVMAKKKSMAKKEMADKAQLGYEGFCPVCIVDVKKWVRGSSEFESTYDNVTYRFPDADTQAVFEEDPAKYIPALGGDCTVCLAKKGKRVPGNIRFASLHQNRVYLFPERAVKEVFDANPSEFADVDLAADGNCVVCAAKMNKEVAGSTDFAAVHTGMRYLFTSDAERQMFLEKPSMYTSAKASMASAPTALSGYCPVCIIAVNKWVEGSPEHSVTFDGHRYLFPDEETKAKFNENPAAYVPALGGDCTVCHAKMGKRVAGKVNHASVYKNRLFLFPNDDQKAMFDASPAEFANVDLAADGNCVVCSKKMAKEVMGTEEFTAVHGGMRYLFPSDSERQMFLATPEEFAMDDATTETSMKKPMNDGSGAKDHGPGSGSKQAGSGSKNQGSGSK